MKKTTKTIERVQYADDCPICDKEIRGFSKNQVLYNLDVHLRQKHNSDEELKEDIKLIKNGMKVIKPSKK